MSRLSWLASVLACVATAAPAFGQESNQPYIDLLKQGLPPEKNPAPAPQAGEPDPYIQSIRREQAPEPAPGSQPSYIDQLRASDPAPGRSRESEGFTAREQQRLEPKKEGGAIQAVMEGRSELKPNREGQITQTFGFKMGATADRSITANSGAGTGRNFGDIYGNDWAPELTLFYEYQVLRRESVGHLGVIASAGLTYQGGEGQFEVPLDNAATGESFGRNAASKFRFFTVPLMIGGRVTLSTLKYVQPYVQAGPTIVGYQESRVDGRSTYRGNSKGVIYGGGANILLDFLTPRTAWDLYSDFKIKRYYLTIDYTRINAANGEVAFVNDTVNAGLTYEF